MTLLRKLWNDEAGFIVSAELVLVATIVVIGMIVGLVVIRNQVVQELVDVGQAFANISQSYAFGGVFGGLGKSFTDGGWYTDVRDFCQVAHGSQTPGTESGGIVIGAMYPSGAATGPTNQEVQALAGP